MVIDQKIDVFKGNYDQNHMSTVGHKSPHNLWITSRFNNQVINTVLDNETLHHLSEWQNTPINSVRRPILNPPFHIELNTDQTAHVLHLKTQLQTNESRKIMIRYYFHSLNIH